jgi:hypothetical protein
VRTDENGVYEIYDLPPGKYTIEPEIPTGWKVSEFYLRYSRSFDGKSNEKSPTKIPIVLESGKHAGLDIHFDPDNVIRGRIYDPAGHTMSAVCLNLLPADGTDGRYLADCTDKGGAFKIDEIPPGRYVLVINKNGEVTSDAPFGTFYYPNVSKREEASVFQIGAGSVIEDVNIYPNRVAETTTVQGTLSYSDEKPVAGGLVRFSTGAAGKSNEARTTTDAAGTFVIKILKGKVGLLDGEMYSFVGDFENCPQLDQLIKQSGQMVPAIKTPAIKIKADQNIHGIELKYPFPSCRKKKRE